MSKVFYLLSMAAATVLAACSLAEDSGNSRRSLSSVLVEVVETHDPKDGTVYVRYDKETGARIVPNPQNDSIE